MALSYPSLFWIICIQHIISSQEHSLHLISQSWKTELFPFFKATKTLRDRNKSNGIVLNASRELLCSILEKLFKACKEWQCEDPYITGSHQHFLLSPVSHTQIHGPDHKLAQTKAETYKEHKTHNPGKSRIESNVYKIHRTQRPHEDPWAPTLFLSGFSAPWII